MEVHRPHPQNGSKQTSQDGINMGPGGKAKSWQTQGDLAQNCREGESSFGVRFVELRRRRLLGTVRHGGGECPALYPPRVMVIMNDAIPLLALPLPLAPDVLAVALLLVLDALLLTLAFALAL